MIQEDDGYFFGLGAFETIAVENGTPVLLEKHYARLYQAAVFLGLSLCKEQIEEEVGKALEKPEMPVSYTHLCDEFIIRFKTTSIM